MTPVAVVTLLMMTMMTMTTTRIGTTAAFRTTCVSKTSRDWYYRASSLSTSTNLFATTMRQQAPATATANTAGGKIKNKNKTTKSKKTIQQRRRGGEFWEAKMDKHVWRPTLNDVERISWGKPAKKKGTGSRNVPHRLNQDERFLFELARRTKGFLELDGSGYRSQRRDSPLLNSYRSLCDARGQVAIVLHKSTTGVDDQIVCDISPLRNPIHFESMAKRCIEKIQQQQHPEHEQHLRNGAGVGVGTIVYQGSNSSKEDKDDDADDEDNNANADISRFDQVDEETEDNTMMEEDLSMTLSIIDGTRMNDDDKNEEAIVLGPWETRPIYQLPPYCISWDTLQRTEAKALGKSLAAMFSTIEEKKNKTKGNKGHMSKKPIGVKAGKSRRHGGYGIG